MRSTRPGRRGWGFGLDDRRGGRIRAQTPLQVKAREGAPPVRCFHLLDSVRHPEPIHMPDDEAARRAGGCGQITIPLPELGARLVVEVEREILAFFSEAGRDGLTVTSGEGAGEPPTEWFINRITRFSSETGALAAAVIAACSYAVPAYFIGRVRQFEAGDPLSRDGGELSSAPPGSDGTARGLD